MALDLPYDDLQGFNENLPPEPLLPSFFENIMVGIDDFAGPQTTDLPPDISNFMPEQDDWLANLDLFGGDFAPNFEYAMENGAPATADGTSPVVSVTGAESAASAARSHASATVRSNIFQRSPHVWIPRSNQNAFSEHNSIQLDEHMETPTSSSLSRIASSLTLGDRMSHATRDELFRAVIRTAKSKILIKTFPSAERLDILLRIGIAKRMETDAWMHPYTFRSAHARPELLIALIAAGCVCFGVPAISRTGLVLLEVVRVALAEWVRDRVQID